MIAGIRGAVERRGVDHLVVAVGGVSLKVLVPGTTLAKAGGPGASVDLRTYLYVREDVIALYGFATAAELETFELLITVSGIGPKGALGILSTVDPGALRSAIAGGNVDLLTQIPGIGKKTAARLVVELKGKLAPLPSTAGAFLPSDENAELVAALSGLGYGPVQIQRALQALPTDPTLDLEERILLALRELQPPG
ncbi:MAG: Holliday junction branch migration protein RuvA [Chloroflexi bacterium]|nr:Holliday junction branch migration protein RuvA [Chloroflexota bacterium]